MKVPAPISLGLLDRRQFCLELALLIAASAARPRLGNAAASGEDIKSLSESSYIYIATVRKDGNQSTAAPVWFVTNHQNEILIDTSPKSWKAKRIKRGSPVLVWIGSRTGPAFVGKAEFVDDRAVQDEMIEQIPKKYFLARIGLFGPRRAKFEAGQIVTIRISPEHDLPEGYASQPGTPAPALEEKR
jgi:general stress protein 26